MKPFTKPQTPSQRIAQLEKDVDQLRSALWTTIAWMAQSANSPISRDDAKKLMEMAQKTEREP